MKSEHFFGEWVEYRNDHEKEEAKIYLNLWKKFFMRKISDLEFVEEYFVDRPLIEDFNGTITTRMKSTLGLKICMKREKLENFYL